MARNHEDLICWQLADKLRGLVIDRTGEGTPAGRDFRFTSNLRDAIGSACRNQSEGFYRYRHTEMRPYFNTAQGSLGEVLDCIEDGRKKRFWSDAEAEEMSRLCRRALKANLKFLHSLKRQDPDNQ